MLFWNGYATHLPFIHTYDTLSSTFQALSPLPAGEGSSDQRQHLDSLIMERMLRARTSCRGFECGSNRDQCAERQAMHTPPVPSRVGDQLTQGSLTNGSIDELIKVNVVGEDDMAAHVEQEALWGHVCAGQAASLLSLQAGQVNFSIICISKYTGQVLTSALSWDALETWPLAAGSCAAPGIKRNQAGRSPWERSPTDSRSVAGT